VSFIKEITDLWEAIKNNKFLKILFYIALIVVIIFYGTSIILNTIEHAQKIVLTQKEINSKDKSPLISNSPMPILKISKQDSQNLDLNEQALKKKSQKKYYKNPLNKETIDKGISTPIDNNLINNPKINLQSPVFNAPVQIGDNNTQNNLNTLPIYNDVQLKSALDSINKYSIKTGYKDVNFYLTSNSNGSRIYEQLYDVFKKNGYNCYNATLLNQPPVNGINFYIWGKIILVIIGNI